MQSLSSQLIIFSVKNSHLFKGRLRPRVIDKNTDTLGLRKEFEEGAQKFGAIPEGLVVTPVRIGEIYAEWIAPAGARLDRAILYTHGGGYVSGSCADHRMHVAKLVQGTGLPTLLYDYRLAPEHPAPAAVEDSLAVYRWMLGQGLRPENIVIAGESAGGGLCICLLIAIRDQGLPLPRAGVASSPWLDLTCTADSYRRNARKDISLQGSWEVWNRYYAGSHDLRHPWISPVYAGLNGLPPMMIQVGDHEIMLDDSVRFAALARAAGGDVTLKIWPGMVHCFAFFSPLFPEAKAGMQELCEYITSQW